MHEAPESGFTKETAGYDDCAEAKTVLNPLTGVPYTKRFYEFLETRQRLPAWGAREQFLQQMQKSQVVILIGETGSGKTTQLPQILLDAGYHVQHDKIRALACVQPCNLAAISGATRIAEELEVPLGTYVGYHVKFDDKTSGDTLLRMLSAEALLREILLDSLLSRYSVVLLDEADGRSAELDLAMSLVKRVLVDRPELKLVLTASSARIQKIQKYFGNAPALQMAGKSQPVELYHVPSEDKNLLRSAAQAIAEIHKSEPEGDILLFVATQDDIDFVSAVLRKSMAQALESKELIIARLSDKSTMAEVQLAVQSQPRSLTDSSFCRRVVITTSVAEASIAVGAITYVIDTGFELQRHFNPRSRLESQHASPASKQSIARRAQRAGTAQRPGKCYRLYTEKAMKDSMPEITHPEIMRSNISHFVLFLKRLGIDDVVHFDFLDPPPPESLMRAFEALHWLNCIDDAGILTECGDKVNRFGLPPQLGKMLVEAPRHRCSSEALSIAAMMSVSPVFLRPSGKSRQADDARARFAHLDGDHLTLLNVFHAFKQHSQDGVEPEKFCGENHICTQALQQAEKTREQLRLISDHAGLPTVATNFQDPEYYPNIRRCVLAGFFMQVAHLENERTAGYATLLEAEEVSIHSSTSLQSKPEWVVFNEFTQTSRSFMKVVTQVRGDWLFDVAPHYFEDLTRFPKEIQGALERAAAKRQPK